ncbi:hypothetical protein RchiOBHm_Chr3g0459551 [Rosa chinensis]|uniref:Uncharacterized protein n=1 Tax=Rosa chinensis TaxID=74649 RepID=A0A2P6R856_ROSCH|nr:hypothetical protein RchiOBHm_Chr3g0459551 [Rosa chinensis]
MPLVSKHTQFYCLRLGHFESEIASLSLSLDLNLNLVIAVLLSHLGDDDLPPWSGVTCSTQGDYRVVTKEVYGVSTVGRCPTIVTNLLDLTRL